MHLLYAALGVTCTYIALKAIPPVWLWIRARYMLRHLPRDTEETSTLLGCPPKMMGPHRHLAYIGPAPHMLGRLRFVAGNASTLNPRIYIEACYLAVTDTAKLGAVTFTRMLWIQVRWHPKML